MTRLSLILTLTNCFVPAIYFHEASVHYCDDDSGIVECFHTEPCKRCGFQIHETDDYVDKFASCKVDRSEFLMSFVLVDKDPAVPPERQSLYRPRTTTIYLINYCERDERWVSD